jgi:hypothetical protein
MLALLVGCAALRLNERAELEIETIQQRERRSVLTDLEARAGASVTIRRESLPGVLQGTLEMQGLPRESNLGENS